MELNMDTLSKEQKRLIDMWYTAYINEENKIVLKEPEVLNDKIKEYKKWIINKQFQDRIDQFSAWYSQAEIDTWQTKIEEAKKVKNWEVSDLLNALIIEWETVNDLATNILLKSEEYTNIYLFAEKRKREQMKNLINN